MFSFFLIGLIGAPVRAIVGKAENGRERMGPKRKGWEGAVGQQFVKRGQLLKRVVF